MAQAHIDDNRVKTLLAYNDTTGLTEPARVDASDDELLIEVYYVTDMLSPTTVSDDMQDDNRVPVGRAIDDDDGTVEPIRADRYSTGYLLVDLA